MFAIIISLFAVRFALFPLGVQTKELNMIAFSKTTDYRHASIPDCLAMIDSIATDNGWNVLYSEDSSIFDNTTLLDLTDVIIFAMPTGDILDDGQKENFEEWYLTKPAGFVGLHAASSAEYDWEFYGNMLGAYFNDHPTFQDGTLTYFNNKRPGNAKYDKYTWIYEDEWYNFKSNPIKSNTNDSFVILGTVNESSYDGGTMGDPHPILWAHHYLGGRSWYSGQGHASDFYDATDNIYYEIVENAILWASWQIDDYQLLESILGDVTTLQPTSMPSETSTSSKYNNNNNSTNETSDNWMFWTMLILGIIVVIQCVFMAYMFGIIKNNKQEKPNLISTKSESMAGVIINSSHTNMPPGVMPVGATSNARPHGPPPVPNLHGY